MIDRSCGQYRKVLDKKAKSNYTDYKVSERGVIKMGKTNRQLQKELTKELLIKTAYELFSEKGIMSTRMADIARAAGVSHGTLFVHFASQEALITEVIELYGNKVACRTHELADSCGSLDEVLTAHLCGIAEFEGFYTQLVIENRLLPEAARSAWISIQSAVSLHFSQAIARGEQKRIPEGIPPYLLFNLWIGLVHYYLANGDLFAPGGSVIARHGDNLKQNYEKLLFGDLPIVSL